MNFAKIAFASLLSTLLIGAGYPACAQNYPNRPISFVVPFAPGGSAARLGCFLEHASVVNASTHQTTFLIARHSRCPEVPPCTAPPLPAPGFPLLYRPAP